MRVKLFSCQYFNIRYQLQSDGTALVRPVQKYEKYEFERIFGFGNHCEGFDCNRTVVVDKSLIVGC
jgi:hypothetical protein